MTHKPNPFDFVPFVESGPNLYSIKEFIETDKLLTGYLTVRIKALTPLHVVGDQDVESELSTVPREREKNKKNFKIIKSGFFRRNGIAIISSSTIRGCLRSFIEAATNGWVSQLTPYYEQKDWSRKYGFKVDSAFHVKNQKMIDKSIPAALDEKYIIPAGELAFIDIASFLFGYTTEEGKARKGCLTIEDAAITEKDLDDSGRFKIPDINDSAFMGGPKPSASSWWYQYPYQIRLREFNDKEGRCKIAADFIGSGFRGRKFYFHQDPAGCCDWYINPIKWSQREGHEVYPAPIECLKAGSVTDEFRIYFDEMPELLLKLLVLALTPGSPGAENGTPTLRHKIGYGKAYGYGSIEYIITGGKIRQKDGGAIEDEYIKQLQKDVVLALWDFDKLNEMGLVKYLHKKNLETLAKIMWFDLSEKYLFQYPKFGYGGFLPVITMEELLSVLDNISKQRLLDDKLLTINRVFGKNLARKLYLKKVRMALHFKVYQENSDNYCRIQERNIYVCK
jgi:hypothetical protein